MDEKIVRQFQYQYRVDANWKDNGVVIVFQTNEMVIDLTGIVRVKDHATDEKKIMLIEDVRHITAATKK